MKDYKINVGYLYNDSFSEKEYLDAVLKKINDDNNAPSYIFDELEPNSLIDLRVRLFLYYF